MPRVIINIQEGVTDEVATRCVLKVIEQGLISKTKRGPCYCFATLFSTPEARNEYSVCAERTRTGTHVFHVAREENVRERSNSG